MCDTLAIVQSDRVLFAKNSDRDANEAQHLDWQPRRTYPAGTKLKCTWIEIPQVAETNAVLLSRPYWLWGAEMGTNEHGVTIGNEAVFTRQPYAKTGLTGMDLIRLALERAATARAAVDTIVGLIEAFGQGGACSLERPGFTYHNSFIVADPQGAFVLETAGPFHAVEEIKGARSISNGLTIPGFAQQHSDTIKTHVSACRLRQSLTQKSADRPHGVADLMRALRDHGHQGETNAAPHYSWLNGGLNAPCVHAGGLVAASQTTGSWVAELTPKGCRHWATATAAPCTSLFKPVAVDFKVDLGPRPTDTFDGETLWWRHERLHRAAMSDPARLLARYASERDTIEAAWLADPPDSDVAFAEYESILERWTADVLAYLGTDTRPFYVRRYWSKRNRQAGLTLSADSAAERRMVQA